MKGRLIECSRSFQDASLQRFGEVLLQVKDGSRLSFEEQQVSGLWVNYHSICVTQTLTESLRELAYE